MSEEFQEHMFEIFAQEENDTNTFNIGTGLGLSIVKNLVELMGGTIRCSSKLGVGTEFFVTMPFQLAEEAEEEQSAENVQYKRNCFGIIEYCLLKIMT